MYIYIVEEITQFGIEKEIVIPESVTKGKIETIFGYIDQTGGISTLTIKRGTQDITIGALPLTDDNFNGQEDKGFELNWDVSSGDKIKVKVTALAGTTINKCIVCLKIKLE